MALLKDFGLLAKLNAIWNNCKSILANEKACYWYNSDVSPSRPGLVLFLS